MKSELVDLSFVVFVLTPSFRVDALYLSHTPAWRSSKFKQAQEDAAEKNEEKHYSRSLHQERRGETEGKASQFTSARTSAETA